MRLEDQIARSRFFDIPLDEPRQPWLLAYQDLAKDITYGDLIKDADMHKALRLVDPANLRRRDSQRWDLARLAQMDKLRGALQGKLGITLYRKTGVGWYVAHPNDVIETEPKAVYESVHSACAKSTRALNSCRAQDMTAEMRRLRDDVVCRIDALRSMADRQMKKPFG